MATRVIWMKCVLWKRQGMRTRGGEEGGKERVDQLRWNQMQLCMQCVKDSCYHSKQQADGVNVNPLHYFGQSGTLRETKWWARYPKIDHECWTDEWMCVWMDWWRNVFAYLIKHGEHTKDTCAANHGGQCAVYDLRREWRGRKGSVTPTRWWTYSKNCRWKIHCISGVNTILKNSSSFFYTPADTFSAFFLQ